MLYAKRRKLLDGEQLFRLRFYSLAADPIPLPAGDQFYKRKELAY
jgi:hypothetical protein